MSSAYHLQTDGQTEVVNRCLETYLRCMAGECPSTWVKWLPLTEWWYNTSFHSTIKMTLFVASYEYVPPFHVPYFPKDSNIESSTSFCRTRRTESICWNFISTELRIECGKQQTRKDHTGILKSEIGCSSNYIHIANTPWRSMETRNSCLSTSSLSKCWRR